MGFLCDCFPRQRGTKVSESSYPRIVHSVDPPPSYSSLPTNITTFLPTGHERRSSWATQQQNYHQQLPTAGNDPPSTTTPTPSGNPRFAADGDEKREKQPLEQPMMDESMRPSSPPSARSSIVSLPSTRLTAPTPSTNNTGASGSLVSPRTSSESAAALAGSAPLPPLPLPTPPPPAYSSLRSTFPRATTTIATTITITTNAGPHGSASSSRDQSHPVLTADWFDQFREP